VELKVSAFKRAYATEFEMEEFVSLTTIEVVERLNGRNEVLNDRNRVLGTQNTKQAQVIFRLKAKIAELRNTIGDERKEHLRWMNL